MFNNKEKVMIAIYAEYQKEDSSIMSIRAKDVGISFESFGKAIMKLQNQGYIDGCEVKKGGMEQNIQVVNMSKADITTKGIDYVEDRLQIGKEYTKRRKLEKIYFKTIDVVWDKGTDFIAKVITEMVKEAKT